MALPLFNVVKGLQGGVGHGNLNLRIPGPLWVSVGPARRDHLI